MYMLCDTYMYMYVCTTGENDHVTITDFGLSKQKQRECSNMKSMVGTFIYWCPELVKDEPYNDKADVWALGCVLYEMCTLGPPFPGGNILHLGHKIVHAEYEPVPPADAATGRGYSADVIGVIKR